MTVVILAGVGYVLWKLGPKHLSTLGTDVLKLEWIRELQARKHKRDQEGMTCEEALTRFARKLIATSAICGATVALVIPTEMSIPIRFLAGATFTVGIAATGFRITRHMRRVLLPLYLTLARIPGTRWDVHSPCRKWIRVPKKPGLPIIVRLPMDYHCGPMQAKMIQEIVTARVPGIWKMEIKSQSFLLKFHPVTTSVVDVGMESESRKDISVSLGEDEIDVMEDMGSPW